MTQNRTSGYYNAELETLAPETREAYLNKALGAIAAHAYAHAPAIHKKFDVAGCKPERLKTVKDLERLPITHKHELAALQQAGPPFGGFLGVPLDSLRRICMSPGPIYEPEALDSQNDGWTQAFYAAGFRRGDIGQITFSYHLVPPAFWFEAALKRLGCIATPGGVGNTELQVRMMKDLGVTGYIGTPSFLMALAQKAREAGHDPRTDLNLKVGFVAGEMLPESLRGELEQTFGMIVRQGYGTADVGCVGYECQAKEGMHFPYTCIVEIVDPETGRQLGPEEPGEIVVTVFDPAYPMIRFGTGDLSYYTTTPCTCGRTAPRLVKILGRLDQVTKVKGMFIHPGQVDEVAGKFEEIRRCQVVVTREKHMDQMTLQIVLKDGVSPSPDLAQRIEVAIPQVMRVRGKVDFVPDRECPENGPKIQDRRKWE